MSLKHKIRRTLIEKRLKVSSHRRNEARERLFAELLPRLEGLTAILSFASKEEEIDLWPLNRELAKEKRLLLTKVMPGEVLTPFKVRDLECDLQETGRWKIKEPLPERCEEISLNQIDCIFVPGLGFDGRKHRLGYGMGHFDRFLSRLNCPFFGIGFKEQFLSELLPVEPHDIPLTEVFLF